MADSVKQQIADLRLLKKEEQDIQELLKSNTKLGKVELENLQEHLKTVQELRVVNKAILDDSLSKLSIGKKMDKAHRGASDSMKKVMSMEAKASQLRAIGNASSETSKNFLEDVVTSQADILKLQKESQIASYDHEQTLKEIEAYEDTIQALKDSGADISKDDYKNMEDSVRVAKQLASAKEEEQAAQEVNNSNADALLGTLGLSMASLKGMWKNAKGFGLAMKAAIAGTGIGILLVALGTLITGLIAAYKFTGTLRDELGISQAQAGMLAMKMAPAAAAIKFMGEDVTKLGAAFIESFGTIESVSSNTLLTAANLRREFGASEESIAGLSKLFTDTLGVSIKDSLGLIKEVGDAFDEAGIAAGTAINEMATNAEFLAEYMDGTVSSMTQAVIEAHRMGLGLSQVSKIADGLLEMEDSITKTMEASLLIGRQLNFDRARGLALEGEVNQAVSDIVGQLGGVAEFQRLNVLQRRGLAEALGVGVDELGALIRGEAIDMKGDPLINSNKELIEAINNNTVTQGGKDLVEQTRLAREKEAKDKEALQEAVMINNNLKSIINNTNFGKTVK